MWFARKSFLFDLNEGCFVNIPVHPINKGSARNFHLLKFKQAECVCMVIFICLFIYLFIKGLAGTHGDLPGLSGFFAFWMKKRFEHNELMI